MCLCFSAIHNFDKLKDCLFSPLGINPYFSHVNLFNVEVVFDKTFAHFQSRERRKKKGQDFLTFGDVGRSTCEYGLHDKASHVQSKHKTCQTVSLPINLHSLVWPQCLVDSYLEIRSSVVQQQHVSLIFGVIRAF